MRMSVDRSGAEFESEGTVLRSTGKPDWQQRLATAVAVLGGLGMLLGGSILETSDWGLPLLLLGGLVMLAGMLWTRHTLKAAIEKAPVQESRARVLNKRDAWEKSGRKYTRMHYLQFRTEDGREMEFQVSDIDHNRWNIGDEGILRWREWQFLSFSQWSLGTEPLTAGQHAGE